jgi:hypothetical protein
MVGHDWLSVMTGAQQVVCVILVSVIEQEWEEPLVKTLFFPPPPANLTQTATSVT